MSLTFDEETFTPDVLADFDIAYEDLDGEDIADNLEVSFDGGAEYRDDNVQADDLGVYKMAYLIDMLIALESAADFCDGAIPLALANLRVGEAASRLTEAAVTLDDEELLAEAELIEKLAENLSQSTADCWEADAYLY